MSKSLKIISWNVNGIRAALNKGFLDFLAEQDPDIICLQETKAMKEQVEIDLPNYTEYWNSAERKGYSGTAIFTKQPALTVSFGMKSDLPMTDKFGDASTEGRVITAEFNDFFVVTVYTPNSKEDLSRLEFREKIWDIAFLNHVKELEKQKPVIFCGDLNVAHTEIDLARPDDNHQSHGFTDQERQGFTNIVASGFVDTFRIFNQTSGNYTWWSNWGGARARNVGWRIDYFCVSEVLKSKVSEAFILPEVMGSDHCPIGIVIEI